MIFTTTRKKAKEIIDWIKENTNVMVMDDPDIYISTPLESIKSDNIQLSYDSALHRLFLRDGNENLNPQCIRCDNKETFLHTIKDGFLPGWAK